MNLRLRSLEIQGFKSFPDKTVLTFKDGITAVVGPNGSGKSNIADAMRWVMGEQSTKTLRGGKMEDVIFGGTQARKAQGYSRVQITIDNADRALPYNEDEISISRKLYRSGESEYRINQANVRLRDVYELFMDTGLGRDGYSIIGQGRISEIVSAKSSQRREIFEEAAGISKYRYRKQEAQRKLEGAEENLLRLRDILIELEARVEPLRLQSEKAMQFLEYAQEKKQLEISLWVTTLDRHKEMLREQEDKLLLCKNRHEEIQGEIDEIEHGINLLYAEMQQLAIQVEQQREQIKALEQETARDTADIAVMRNDIAHNEASIDRLGKELTQADASDRELEEQLAFHQEELTSKQQQLALLQEEQAEGLQRSDVLKAEQTELTLHIDALKERRFGISQSINETKLSTVSSGSLIEESISRLKVLKESAVVKDENIERILREQTDCTELLGTIDDRLESLQNAQQGYRLKLESKQARIDEFSEKERRLADQERGCLQKAKLLFDMENSLEGFHQSVKYIMGQASKGALSGVCGPVSRLISVEEEHALAIEIALGAAMQNIAVENESIAKRAISLLKESRAGRATFLPLTTVKGNRLKEDWLANTEGFVGLAAELVSCESRFDGMINQLLGRIVVVSDIDCAAAVAKQAGYRFRIVTLDGQVVNAGGSMTGGYAAKSAGILSRSGEIESLKAQAQGYRAEIIALETQEKQALEELSALRAILSGVNGELMTAQEDKIRYAAEHKQLLTSYEEAVRIREYAAKEYDDLTARLSELREKNMSGEGLLQEFSRQLDEVAQELSFLYEKKENLTQQAEALTSQLSEKNIAVAGLFQEMEGIRRVAAQLSGQKDDRRGRSEEMQRELAEYQLCNQTILSGILQKQEQIKQQQKQVALLQEEMQQTTAKHDQAQARTTALRGGEKEVISRRELAARELARLEEQKMTLQGEYDSIISRLWDEYEVTRTQAVSLCVPIEDTGKAKHRLSELKSKIKQLGNVNVGAVEEYREVSERYRFLKDQTDDAEKSRTELLRLIHDLTREMQTIFANHFEQISSHFSNIFIELFGGGRAELTLTDPENILESGIEIYVQPPGKIIKNLASLSGGEQAFVAIAIYFAILKVRPSPFCLLDEIEAALDDVNVVKYAQYLRTMCEKTQFIAITHRRGTMEEADILYGVTMQEEGVSKLLALNVSELESKLGIK